MMFEVYAIREVGSKEARYIGQTGKGCRTRIGFLVSLARRKIGDKDMRDWLQSCCFNVEAVPLAYAETRQEAKAKERLAIEMFAKCGHRLLNRQFFPADADVEPVTAPVARKMVKAA